MGGEDIVMKGQVYEYVDPYWRVLYEDGDWEELSSREMSKFTRAQESVS